GEDADEHAASLAAAALDERLHVFPVLGFELAEVRVEILEDNPRACAARADAAPAVRHPIRGGEPANESPVRSVLQNFFKGIAVTTVLTLRQEARQRPHLCVVNKQLILPRAEKSLRRTMQQVVHRDQPIPT